MKIKPIDDRVRETFPQPIAAAWHRVLAATSGADRIRQQLACLEVLFRTVGCFCALDYIRGPRVEKVDLLFETLKKPTMGHWVTFIREAIRAIRNRDGQAFFQEPSGWYFDALGKPSEAAQKINGL